MRTRISNVRVFDGEQRIDRTTVLIEDGWIVAPDDIPADVEIDGTGRTLLPGLIDAHTHIFDGDLAAALTFGVTTELDMFCLPEVLTAQRAAAASRDDIADFRSAATLATAPGGHPSQLLASPDIAALGLAPFDTISGPEQAADFVQARLAEGADYLKIVIDDGAVHGTGLPVLSPQTAQALAAHAHDAGLKVIAHAITEHEVAIALDAGVDGLAHVWTDLTDRTLELADRIAARDVFVVSTLVYFEAITGQRESTADCARPGSFADAVRVARALHEAGVPLLAGTDATPYVPAHGSGLHRELALLIGVGMSPLEVLRAATSRTADRFGLPDRGRIAPGLRADLLLVDGDPTTDITATSEIAEVWRRGVRQVRR
ncbi:amidohydrolase family protein [Nocardia cyriacigeorgica]|uniref:amidohydrolase family protein n=1 Tax=Nocardia cyriacigeorgica TaxID=135487 RepID=UPI000CEA073E|nr:amidohydrolase family protein [Nocardia cyriacigeorgica]AVH22658.1 amidohydrolase [Nocardia cyriacigeorgica]MBF6498857.1 amidohydrolase family protein [Nocardia cyriacigeorgica]PPJ14552.1 amidohydrolase [Nocardia cyriacigeorgica]